MIGGIRLNSKTADVVLTLTDVRSTEQVSLQQGHAKKTDLGWAGASGYANTEIGQVVTMAKPGKIYETPNVKVVRNLDPGMTLYPSDEEEGIWWKACDKLGNEGWVSSTLFQLAK